MPATQHQFTEGVIVPPAETTFDEPFGYEDFIKERFNDITGGLGVLTVKIDVTPPPTAFDRVVQRASNFRLPTSGPLSPWAN